MTWVRLDDHFDEHPKVASLSDSALALWVTALAYCNRNLTDGFVPSMVGIGKLRYCEGNPTPAINELTDRGMWVSVEGGWMIHDYLDFQPSKGDVLRERAQTRNRVSKYRSNATSNAVTNASGNDDVPGTGSTKALDPKDKEFEAFWTVFPRKVGKRAARAAFDGALERASAETIIAAAERFRNDVNREPEFTPHPTTWLNQDRWEDDPQPKRGKGKSVSNILALAERSRDDDSG